MNKLAVQLWTFRKQLEKDAEETLRKIKLIGFNHVELAGTAGHNPADFALLLNKHELKVVGIHQPSPMLWPKVSELVGEYTVHLELFGCHHLVLLTDAWTKLDSSYYEHYSERLSQIHRDIDDTVSISVHPYHTDFLPQSGMNGKSGMRIVNEKATAELLIEPDLHWVACSNRPFREALSCWEGRIKMVHLNGTSGAKIQQPLDIDSETRGALDWLIEMDLECGIIEHDCAEPLSWCESSRNNLLTELNEIAIG